MSSAKAGRWAGALGRGGLGEAGGLEGRVLGMSRVTFANCPPDYGRELKSPEQLHACCKILGCVYLTSFGIDFAVSQTAGLWVTGVRDPALLGGFAQQNSCCLYSC